MKRLLILCTAYVIMLTMAFGQNEANIWCFGANVGLDFNSGSPVYFSGSAMSQWEGCSSIADASGDLLFYTDGITVWNKNHAPMPNGNGLFGGYSSTQSAVIVKQPGNANIYYIFTTPDMGGPAGFNYSTVDISLQAGLGDVVMKNINLLPQCDERVTGARHSNGVDAWIITTSMYSDTLYAYLLSGTGLNPVPVISYNGLTHGSATYNSIGSVKASQAGDKLGIAMNGDPGTFELYTFDNTTGVATLVMSTTSTDYKFAYGVEFSPSGNVMYGSEYGNGYHIYQFDLLAGSGAAIAASALLIGTSTGYSAALQIAPDGKIYLAKWMETSLAAIEDPDQLGLACNFNDNAISFPATCNGGLPNIMPGFLQIVPVALFTAPNHICPGTCTDFANLSQNATTFLWSFQGANPSTSTDMNPMNICYNTPGTYPVQLIASNSLGSDTLTLNNYITVYPSPPPQGILQNGDTLMANQGATSYQWYHDGALISGATDYIYVAPTGGNYNVVATDANGCEVEAAIFDVIATISRPEQGLATLLILDASGITLEVRSSDFGFSPVALNIYNSIGEKLQGTVYPAGNPFRAILNIENLAAGFYLVELFESGKSYTGKILKSIK